MGIASDFVLIVIAGLAGGLLSPMVSAAAVPLGQIWQKRHALYSGS